MGGYRGKHEGGRGQGGPAEDGEGAPRSVGSPEPTKSPQPMWWSPSLPDPRRRRGLAKSPCGRRNIRSPAAMGPPQLICGPRNHQVAAARGIAAARPVAATHGRERAYGLARSYEIAGSHEVAGAHEAIATPGSPSSLGAQGRPTWRQGNDGHEHLWNPSPFLFERDLSGVASSGGATYVTAEGPAAWLRNYQRAARSTRRPSSQCRKSSVSRHATCSAALPAIQPPGCTYAPLPCDVLQHDWPKWSKYEVATTPLRWRRPLRGLLALTR